MNRHERRRAEREARKASSSFAEVVAIHEAGHAVARYLTAMEMGFDPSDAIAYIDVGLVPVPYASMDGKAMLVSSAVTFGPMYSRPMIDHLHDNPVSSAIGAGHPTTLETEVAACRNAGVDVLSWAKCKALVCMAGPVAESRFTARPIDEVVHSYECENDLRDAARDCLVAGMTEDEATNICDNALDLAKRIFAERDIWHAVVALADRLPAKGRLEGHRAASIILEALRSKQTQRDPRLSADGLAS
jgi:hypothetical protein